MCDWPGIERQIAVVRVISALPEIDVDVESDDCSSEEEDDHEYDGGDFLGPDDHQPAI